jgi:hypothetical protein
MVRKQIKLLVSNSPSSTEWYERFMKGLHKRLGDNSKPDLAISIDVILELMKGWTEAKGDRGRERNVLFPAVFVLISYTGGLSGEKTPLMDLAGMYKHIGEATNILHPHVVVALLGRFKSETGETYHMKPIVSVTNSGLQVQSWVSRALAWLQEERVTVGPKFRR